MPSPNVGTDQGRRCMASTNATRAVFGMEPIDAPCSTCEHVGTCLIPQACERPIELRPIRRRLFTRPRFSKPFLIGAAFAIPGAVLFAYEGLRYFLQH